MEYHGLSESVFKPIVCNVDNESKSVIISMLTALDADNTDSKKMESYTNCEFDSNQTIFEFIFNNNDLHVKSNTKPNASVLLYILEYIINIIFDTKYKNKNFIKQLKNYINCSTEYNDSLTVNEIDELNEWLNSNTKFATFNVVLINKYIAELRADQTSLNNVPAQQVYKYPKYYDKFITECKKILCDENGDITANTLTNYFSI